MLGHMQSHRASALFSQALRTGSRPLQWCRHWYTGTQRVSHLPASIDSVTGCEAHKGLLCVCSPALIGCHHVDVCIDLKAGAVLLYPVQAPLVPGEHIAIKAALRLGAVGVGQHNAGARAPVACSKEEQETLGAR